MAIGQHNSQTEIRLGYETRVYSSRPWAAKIDGSNQDHEPSSAGGIPHGKTFDIEYWRGTDACHPPPQDISQGYTITASTKARMDGRRDIAPVKETSNRARGVRERVQIN
jgi:hypothetical protein